MLKGASPGLPVSLAEGDLRVTSSATRLQLLMDRSRCRTQRLGSARQLTPRRSRAWWRSSAAKRRWNPAHDRIEPDKHEGRVMPPKKKVAGLDQTADPGLGKANRAAGGSGTGPAR